MYVPAIHKAQAAWPTMVLYVPATQSVHVVAVGMPDPEEYLPVLQVLQTVIPEPTR